MSTKTTTYFFPSAIEALAHYGSRELAFCSKSGTGYALADNSDGALIDAITAAGAYVMPRHEFDLLVEEEKDELEYRAYMEEQERLERFRYLDGDHHIEQPESLPEHDYPG